MLIKYVDRNFSISSLSIIEKANSIIEEFEGQGFDLTLRQLYYQFVSRDLIPNQQREYKRLGSIINDARLAGLISWKAIVDRTRNIEGNSHWTGPREIIESCASQFQIDKWKNQGFRVEVWIEKDALVGVIERICRNLDVSYFSCRGYTSQSEMWSAAQRLKAFADENEQVPVIIHLGDHDPSGIDMTRDITDRLDLFMGGIEVNRIALNIDQVNKYKPPPNPAKITDSRSPKYIKKYGRQSWELDALSPKTISDLIEKTVKTYRDESKWRAMKEVEKEHIEALNKVAEELS